jgi:hypothetical protein
VVEDGQPATDVFRSIRSLVQRAEPRMDALDINHVIEEVLVLARGELQNQDVLVRAELKATLPRLRGDRGAAAARSFELGHQRHTGDGGGEESPAGFDDQAAASRA